MEEHGKDGAQLRLSAAGKECLDERAVNATVLARKSTPFGPLSLVEKIEKPKRAPFPESSSLQEPYPGIITVTGKDLYPHEWSALEGKEEIIGLSFVNSPVSDAMFADMIADLPNLRELRMTDCANISDAVFEGIYKTHPELRITIENCPHISPAIAGDINSFTEELRVERSRKIDELMTKHLDR